MPDNTKNTTNLHDIEQQIRGALRREQAVWSAQCPDAETLLNWIENATAHPQADALLSHFTTCAYCRRQFAAQCEIRALTREQHSQFARIKTWANELAAEGFLAPLQAMRASLARLERLSLTLDSARSVDTPNNLQPAFTAVRSPQPTLQWTGADAAQEYSVLVARPAKRKQRSIVWRGSAGSEQKLILPLSSGLKPGNTYLWQVIAHRAAQEYPSAPVTFVVLSEQRRREVEALELTAREQEAGNLQPALISIYEAYGLYGEALQQAESYTSLAADETAMRILLSLQQRLQTAQEPEQQ